ncbi:hypothetical protein ACOSQ4_012779 [Xanthoceras sorbifolium]
MSFRNDDHLSHTDQDFAFGTWLRASSLRKTRPSSAKPNSVDASELDAFNHRLRKKVTQPLIRDLVVSSPELKQQTPVEEKQLHDSNLNQDLSDSLAINKFPLALHDESEVILGLDLLLVRHQSATGFDCDLVGLTTVVDQISIVLNKPHESDSFDADSEIAAGSFGVLVAGLVRNLNPKQTSAVGGHVESYDGLGAVFEFTSAIKKKAKWKRLACMIQDST